MKDVSHTFSIIFLSGDVLNTLIKRQRLEDWTTQSLRQKYSTREKGKHVLVIKVLTHQEDIIIINIYKPSNRASKCRWQYLTKLYKERQFNSSSWWCQYLISIMNRTRQRINNLNNTVHQLHLIDNYITLHTTAEFTFSSAHETLSKRDHIYPMKQVLIYLKGLKLHKGCDLNKI